MYMYSMCIIKVGVRDDWSVGYVQKQLTVIGLHRLLCFQWKLKLSSQRRHLISSFAVYAVEWAWKRTAFLRHCFLPRSPPIFFWSVHCCSIYSSAGPLGPAGSSGGVTYITPYVQLYTTMSVQDRKRPWTRTFEKCPIFHRISAPNFILRTYFFRTKISNLVPSFFKK